MNMTQHHTGSALLDTALEYVEEGINVAIVPIQRTDTNKVRVLAVLQDPSRHKIVNDATYSNDARHRARAATHLILQARKAAIRQGMRPA